MIFTYYVAFTRFTLLSHQDKHVTVVHSLSATKKTNELSYFCDQVFRIEIGSKKEYRL